MEAKIVFITGASSGIGEGCARKFAKEGWNLILNARTVSKLEELKAELEGAYGVQVYILPFDVRARKLAAASLESLPEEWKAIDVLVNNAGLVIGVDKEFEGNLDEWDIMIDTNIRGLLAMTRLVVPGMVERGRGHIAYALQHGALFLPRNTGVHQMPHTAHAAPYRGGNKEPRAYKGGPACNRRHGENRHIRKAV